MQLHQIPHFHLFLLDCNLFKMRPRPYRVLSCWQWIYRPKKIFCAGYEYCMRIPSSFTVSNIKNAVGIFICIYNTMLRFFCFVFFQDIWDSHIFVIKSKENVLCLCTEPVFTDIVFLMTLMSFDRRIKFALDTLEF